MTTPLIRVATVADRDAAVATFVAAFASDSAVRYFIPDDAGYPQAAGRLGAELFDKRVGLGSVWVAGSGAAIALWDPPGGGSTVDGGTTEYLVDRERFDRYQAVVHRVLPTFPHWYLGVLAAHPEQRGRRLGRGVMAPGLERAAADGLPAYLETSNPRNVAVYRSVGFDVAAHIMVDELPVWVMSWQPAVPGSPPPAA